VQAGDQPSAPARAGLVLITLILAAGVANINLAVANVALPDIGKAFTASQTALDLVAVGYSLGLAASVLYLGAIGDRYGRKLLLVLGMALSVPACLLAAYAPSTAVLVAARLVGGLSAGMAYPTTLALVAALWAGPARTRAIALWSGIGSALAALGPLVSGLLLEYFWWGSVFVFTVPFAVIALVMATVYVPAHVNESTSAVDNLGGILSLVLVTALILASFLAMLLLWKQGSPYWQVGLAYALLGIGVGLFGTPASNSLTGSVPVDRTGMASGTADLQRDLGGAIMQSIFGALLPPATPPRSPQRSPQRPTRRRSPPAPRTSSRSPSPAPPPSPASTRNTPTRSPPEPRPRSCTAPTGPTPPASSRPSSASPWCSSCSPARTTSSNCSANTAKQTPRRPRRARQREGEANHPPRDRGCRGSGGRGRRPHLYRGGGLGRARGNPERVRGSTHVAARGARAARNGNLPRCRRKIDTRDQNGGHEMFGARSVARRTSRRTARRVDRRRI